MAKKTVRILRTLPLLGIIYQANDLVVFDDKELEKMDSTAYDDDAGAVEYCTKTLGIKSVAVGKDPRAKPPVAKGKQAEADDTGEQAE